MRSVNTIFILLLAISANSQNGKTSDITKVKEEIRQLFVSLNNARLAHDKATLEKIYADEFVVIHAPGYIDDKATTINETLETDSIRALPIPNLDNLVVYGDVAILRQAPSIAASTVFANRIINTYIYTKKNGSWQITMGQGTALLPERKYIKLEPAVLDSYTGKYEGRLGQYIIMTRSDDILLLNLVNRGIPKRRLSPVADAHFYDNIGSEYTFTKDDKGKITGFLGKFANGQQAEWRKIE
jgi:hypothetical protein